jgi:phosphatidylserine/phosphatidylglycerophosphate/cardiolipin synthase-like enzyme
VTRLTLRLAAHPIADAHPGNVDATVFPGQDFNNARVYDFDDVSNWKQNKRKLHRPEVPSLLHANPLWQVDRTKSSRMGWTDISMSLVGPVVDSLQFHFVDRWNYIFDQKYKAKDGSKYELLVYTPNESHHHFDMRKFAHQPGEQFGHYGRSMFQRHAPENQSEHQPEHQPERQPEQQPEHQEGEQQSGGFLGGWGERWNRHVSRFFDRDSDDEEEHHQGGHHHGGAATIQITRRYWFCFGLLARNIG